MKKLGLILGVVVLLGSGLTACSSDKDSKCQNRTECNKSKRNNCDENNRRDNKQKKHRKGDKRFENFTQEERNSFRTMRTDWANFDQLDETKQTELISKAKVFADSTIARRSRKQAAFTAEWNNFETLSTIKQKELLETLFSHRFHNKKDRMNKGNRNKHDERMNKENRNKHEERMNKENRIHNDNRMNNNEQGPNCNKN